MVSQTISTKVAYAFSNGAASLGFPVSGSLVSGTKFLYISPDGNFVFGGSPTGWDFFVGVRTGTGAPNFGGLLPSQAGIDEFIYSNLAGGLLDTYYGAVAYLSSGSVGHERVASIFSSTAFDYTYSDPYTANATTYGTPASSPTMRYAVGAGGAVRIGSGIGPNLGLNVTLAAPTLSGSGVYLNPLGIVNAASWAPFTQAIVPGEFLTLFGTGLAPSGFSATSTIPFPHPGRRSSDVRQHSGTALLRGPGGDLADCALWASALEFVTIQVINSLGHRTR